MAQERATAVGQEIGYQIGMDRVAGAQTRLTYLTTGVLKQKLVTDKQLSSWSHIILDEGNSKEAFVELVLKV